MLELLGARAHQERLDIETRVMDGHQLELADNTFDMAGSQFGVMLFPDMPKRIREMARVGAQHAERLRLILARLNAATAPPDMALPGLDLHPLKGERKGTWAVSVSGNWRVTFRFVGKDGDAVDYEDYH